MNNKLFEKCYEMSSALYRHPIFIESEGENLKITNTAIDIYHYIESKEFEFLAILSMNRAIYLYREQRFSREMELTHSLSDMSNEIYQIILQQLRANNFEISLENVASDNL